MSRTNQSASSVDPRRLRRDSHLTQSANLAFSIAQAMAAVIVPILAVSAGHDIGLIGLIVAVSAVSQTVARLGMGALMSRLPTKHFIATATLLLSASCLLLGFSTELWAFVVAQLLQGAARAYFWTGSQTHVVRASDSAVTALSRLNVVQGIGQLIGPALAGVLGAWSLQISLLAAGALAAVALAPAIALVRFAPFPKRSRHSTERPRQIWRQPGVGMAASMTAIGGAWRGIVNSYLPVILTAAGYSVPVAGALMTVANLASLGGSALSRRIQAAGPRAANAIGTAGAGLGLALASFFPNPIWAVVVGLAISGAGAGILQTVGPALAADSTSEDDRGRAIASIGTFRSISLLASPLAAAGLVLIVPSAAVAAGIAGIIISTPSLTALIRPRGKARTSREGTHEHDKDFAN
ncbi:MFS transporter [Sinomonas mesophila]|uniref:MFS transporter n=1 Tax=Sinomonas mesophila TaxID=1531955 RepID=UPI0009870773|nr:MFS transporter [Sinomonas mesophila]